MVIFGAAVRPDGSPSQTLRRRVEAALAHGRRRHPPPLYVPTGAKGRHGPSEASVMARLLREGGVPPADILEEPTGTDTLSSARAVAGLLRDWHGPVLVASSGYHIPRCVLLLRLLGLPARPGPAARAAPGFQDWRWRLREAPAIPYDAALALWHRRAGRGPAPAA
ncbi:hypothetical protein RGI145_10060 [Roseomonas gilardii]|uniref:DUF218 domain-containing protein n=1 Tax=Roseomonas gilardii TaxID=257708 RepID=A0A1L7AFD0_9PROT|nr:hypothetical protein RGI145_10060 [Roseomonas gilardii]